MSQRPVSQPVTKEEAELGAIRGPQNPILRFLYFLVH